MANKFTSQASRRLLADAVASITTRVPRAWDTKVVARTDDGASIRLTAPDSSTGDVSMLARPELEPRAVEAMGAPATATIVAARWLSPRSRSLLSEAGWNYVDTTGNIYLAIDRPGLFIQADGATRDPSPKPRGGPNLRGPRAWAMQRSLAEVRPPYGVTEISTALGIDPGYVSRLLGALSEELLVDRRARGPVQSVEWEPLLRQVATTYTLLGSNETTSWMAPGGAEQFLRDLSSSKLQRWAVTGSFAASRLVSVAAPEVAVVFTEDPDRLAERMRLRPVRNGGNVVTALPYDPVVFDRTWRKEGIVYASVAQVAIDSMGGFGRMPAEADALLQWMRRSARWQASSFNDAAALP